MDTLFPCAQIEQAATCQLEGLGDVFGVIISVGSRGFYAPALFHAGLLDKHRQPRCIGFLSVARQRARSFRPMAFAAVKAREKRSTKQSSEQAASSYPIDPALNALQLHRVQRGEIGSSIMKTKMSVVPLGLITAILGFLYGGSNQPLAAENETKPPQFIYIGGEVKVPQRYVYSDDLTLGKAIKMAKGVTSKASDKVTLTRQDSDEQTFKLKSVQKGDATQVKLKPGDKVFVPRKE